MDYTEYNAGHLTGQPTADDVIVREPATFGDPAGCIPGPALAAAEVVHFKEHGFLVKRRKIDDDQACTQAVRQLWDNGPRGILRRHEPATWLDAPDEKWLDDDVARVGRLPGEKYQWWVDTRNFHEDVPPTADNMWSGWGI